MNNNDPMIEAIFKFPEMMKEAFRIFENHELKNDYSNITNIVYCGMGGSGISGDLLKNFFRGSLPVSFEIVRHYTLPAYVDKGSLILACSYSGNTEETLSAVEEGLSRGAKAFAVTSGGKLRQLCESNHQDYILVPGGYQPRAALGYLFIPFFLFIGNVFASGDFKESWLEEAVELCSQIKSEVANSPDDNQFSQLAREMEGCLPLIYGESSSTAAIATRFKCQICENSKLLAFANEFPELNHNEIVGYENLTGILKNLYVFILNDREDHPRVTLRQKFTTDLIKPHVKMVKILEGEGQSRLSRWLTLIYKADFLSWYLSLIYKTPATPIDKIDKLKKLMSAAR